MVITIQNIYQPRDIRYSIAIRDNRAGDESSLSYDDSSKHLGKQLGADPQSLELTLFSDFGTVASIVLEDNGNSALRVSGDIDDQQKEIPVYADTDFDATLTNDGYVSLENRDNAWGDGEGHNIRVKINSLGY